MQLTQRYSMIGLIFITVGCGPETASTWMLGTFSTVQVGITGDTAAVGRFEFRADGTVIFGGVGSYGNSVLETEEYMWERRGEDAIEVLFPETYAGIEAWRIMPSDDCNVLRREYLVGGEVVGKGLLYRGAVCLQKLDPCPDGSQCPSNLTVWCDEAPPECDDG